MASLLVCVRDYEEHAKKVLPKMSYDFFRGGSGEEQTLTENRKAFKRWQLIPRVLRGTSQREMGVSVFGKKVSCPFGISPLGFQGLAHPSGEIATARAAADEGIIFVLSTMSNTSIEDIAQSVPGGIRWFQLYVYKDRQSSVNLIRRAEKCGFQALVVTVDTPVIGTRRADLWNKFSLPNHLRLANFAEDREKTLAANKASGSNSVSGSSSLVNISSTMLDPSLSWEDIAWLKTITKLPVVLKGILSPRDAELAVQYGVDGIVVSNHGGRQLDGVPATIDVLPSVVDRVRGRCEVFFDGGITQGTDVLKALALGAKMAFIGRPVIWGLAHSGEDGVKNIIKMLKNELDTAMALCGCSSVKDITRDFLQHRYASAKL